MLAVLTVYSAAFARESADSTAKAADEVLTILLVWVLGVRSIGGVGISRVAAVERDFSRTDERRSFGSERRGARSDGARGGYLRYDSTSKVEFVSLLRPENNPEPLAKSAHSAGYATPSSRTFPTSSEISEISWIRVNSHEKKCLFYTETSICSGFYTKSSMFRTHGWVRTYVRSFSHTSIFLTFSFWARPSRLNGTTAKKTTKQQNKKDDKNNTNQNNHARKTRKPTTHPDTTHPQQQQQQQ